VREAIRLAIKISQSTLAGRPGVMRQRINVVFQGLRQDGLIRLSHSQITTADSQQLAEWARL
jgi:hypothetical protein